MVNMLAFYHSPNKKIRGWKRRIKQVNKWGEIIKTPFIDRFLSQNDSNTYYRCTISPFYALEKRQPPLWFFKLIISKFILAYFEWDKVFKKLVIPYDLQIWIYDPHFIWSEIICYRMEGDNELRRHVWESENQKAFPSKRFKHESYDLEQFSWKYGDEEHVIFESDLEDEETTASELLNQSFIKKQQFLDEVYYAKKIGDIWIGRLKST